ncbi:hypothetical protein [Limnohabitans sp. MMS-10A-192]|uniref:hypothetical protein n=1 Tax=Limnohabitans sp. MMS-10A-192 TaxID=1835769 RepID=UPI0011B1C754|nr:hypothetical protein [Limnohabitans sp. MMS-10A-192]
MAFEETKVIDQITVTENGIILFREATRVLRDGVVIAETFHRSSAAPSQDISGLPENVAEIAQVVWKPEVIAAFEAERAASAV